MTKRQLPEGWRMVRLRDVLSTLESGLRPKGGVRGVLKGVASIGAEHLNDEGGFDLSNLRYIPQDFYTRMQRGRIQAGDILVVKDGATTGKVSFVPSDWPFDKSAANEHVFVLRPNREALAEYLFFYLYSPVGQHDIKKSFHGSAQGGINQSFAAHVPVPLPPLPVQERIVQILQKADEIRRKRKEALDLAETLRRALFVNMFGEPGNNERSWPVGPLGQLLTPEIERINPSVAWPDDDFTYIEIAAVHGYRITHPKRLLGKEAPSRARQVVKAGDILYSMTRPNLRNIAVVPEELDRAICTTGFCVLRPKRPEDGPFVFEIVKSDYFTEAMSRLAEAKSLYPAVDESQIRDFQVIQPPEPARAHFGRIVQKLSDVEMSVLKGLTDTEAIFATLLSRAFTGELTADWEAVNAEAIRQRQAFEEQVPRLVALDLLAEKAASTAPAAPEAGLLLTAMMKLLFLVQMKGSARRRFYHFVPYHYGPFAKELYDDLERLQQEGLVSIEQADEDKTRLMLADADRARQMVAQLPDDLRQDVRTVLDEYGGLTHNQLLARVYEEFPAYARRSRLRHAAAKKAGTGRSAT